MKNNKKLSIPGHQKARRFITPRVKKKHATVINEDRLPRITNDTVSQHREEVIAGAKKYKYPLKHSQHKIVIITVSILVAIVIGFTTFTLISLYKYQSTSAFIYQITKVVPLPIAKIGGSFVSYEEYLFELRHYIHYFEQQQEVDFANEGAGQLEEQKRQSLEATINNAYAKKIARDKEITVSNEEIDAQIALLRDTNRLGSDDAVFEDVLKDYYNWSITDFKRSIKQELLNAKVIKALDTEAQPRAEQAIAELKAGADFATVAKNYSNDAATKEAGGELGFLISKNDRNIPAQTINALSTLKPGEVSGIIDLGYGLEIVKLLSVDGDKYKAAHISLSYKDLGDYLNDTKEKQPATVYIKIPEPKE